MCHLLEIRDLEVSLANTLIVKNATLKIDKGEFIALVGESGSGKSVTAHSILNLFPKSSSPQFSGSIIYDKKNLLQLNNQEMCRIRGSEIAMIFQDALSALNPLMKVGQQIAEPLIIRGKNTKSEITEHVLNLLDYVGIRNPKTCYHQYPHELSGGMRQRVMIAIALASKPKLLIADEPTTALDVSVQAKIIKLLQKIQRETDMSILLITHDLGVVAGTCNRGYVMDKGVISDEGSIEYIFYESTNPATRKLIDQIQWRCNV
ncbi:MAG: ABC transporter ATP-binding protein [Chlamydiota bacterium]|nr:ABC transporter ATP-binding protein [Chlamydiota bacterium]